MNPPPKTCFVVGPIGKEGTDARVRADALLKQTTFLTALLVYSAAAPVAVQWQLTVNKYEISNETNAAFCTSPSTPSRNAVGIPINPKPILACTRCHSIRLYVCV